MFHCALEAVVEPVGLRVLRGRGGSREELGFAALVHAEDAWGFADADAVALAELPIDRHLHGTRAIEEALV